ncbi:hypothetical protein M408DRAFT_198303 [Serendipita vermifera MAFF 305830]|uniref:SprT-like domain-containing protein n=1 Tax=Serendipita vermifera MAFF 305830 TaxID=933852 RepID=A0A0C3B1C4_SERVB|nr:hypothetical protein M408DRAFT_198303 [Serendipita vermifera MAFF 305830]
MPREVFRNTGVHNVIQLTDSESEPEHESPQKRSLKSGASPDKTAFVSNSSSIKSPLKQGRRPVEIIELSSSEDEDIHPTGKRGFTAPSYGRNAQPSTSAMSIPQAGPMQNNIRTDVVVENNGTIQYNPSPRRRPAALNGSPSKSDKSGMLLSDRIRLLSKAPKVNVPEPEEDLSWEHEEDGLGGVRSGAMLIGSYDPVQDQQETLAPGDPSPLSSSSKVARQKKMPEAVAVLHRLAIPFLKEMDRKVFNNQLGASYLPDLIPSSGQKRRRKDDKSVIWGMGSRGEYDDGHGSYTELVWSNRMATTAGRSEYKKTGEGKIIIKIELGVKVITTEERLRNTLAHEACHAASWAISKDFKAPHGSTFKSWYGTLILSMLLLMIDRARKVEAAFRGVQVTTKHDYEIDYKYSWKCLAPSCGHVFQRHSNSINIEKQGCFCGSRLEPQFKLSAKRVAPKGPISSQSHPNLPENAEALLPISRGTPGDDLVDALTLMAISSSRNDEEAE